MCNRLLSTVRRCVPTALLASVVAGLAATQTLAAPLCTPDVAITGAHLSEAFTWRPGAVEVSLDFAADEAVLDYSVGYVRPCACRAVGSR